LVEVALSLDPLILIQEVKIGARGRSGVSSLGTARKGERLALEEHLHAEAGLVSIKGKASFVIVEFKDEGTAVGYAYKVHVGHQPLHHVSNLVIMSLVQDILQIIVRYMTIYDTFNFICDRSNRVAHEAGAD
jgi:hypothetical protein